MRRNKYQSLAKDALIHAPEIADKDKDAKIYNCSVCNTEVYENEDSQGTAILTII